MSTETDELVARIRGGDEAAFGRLVDTRGPALVRLAARVVGDVHAAEDVVQDALLKAYRAIKSGHFQGRSQVQTWLYRIVTNAALDARRARRRHDVTPLEGAGLAPEQADARLALQELAAWLDELPERQRAVLVLSALEGLSQREIAQIEGCSEGAVEQRLVRARASLRVKGASNE